MSDNPFSNQSNPYASPNLGSSGFRQDEQIDAESKKQLNGARWAMIIVGCLTIAVSVFLFLNAENEVRELAAEELRNGFQIDQPAVLLMCRTIYGAQLALGVIFLILGTLVMRFPLLCTLTGLLLYIGSIAVFGLIDPTTIVRGIIIKIIIVVVLGKAVATAFNLKKSRGFF